VTIRRRSMRSSTSAAKSTSAYWRRAVPVDDLFRWLLDCCLMSTSPLLSLTA
jgi:hypothetical protein